MSFQEISDIVDNYKWADGSYTLPARVRRNREIKQKAMQTMKAEDK